MKSNEIYQFENFRLEAEKPLLWYNDEIVPLKPKALETLVALVRNSGEVVTKNDLMEEVWADSFVEENNLSRNIYELRKTLKKFGGKKFIETIPRRGYRFAGEVKVFENGDEIVIERQVLEQTLIEEFSDDDFSIQKTAQEKNLSDTKNSLPSAFASKRFPVRILMAVIIVLIAGGFVVWRYRTFQTEASLSEIKTIAVLPLKSFSSESVDESLRLRITDALITKLGNLDKIAVRPTNSVLSFADETQDAVEAGKRLEVDAVLDGRVQEENDRLRVTVQLISVKTGEQLWSEQFDGRMGETLALQDLIANRLQQKLSFSKKESFNRRPTESDEAYEAYLRGRYLWNKRTTESYWKALESFQKSVAADPNFALGYTGIADSYYLLNQRGALFPEAAFPKAEAAAQKALELNPTLAEAHASLGAINEIYYGRWAKSEDFYKRAIELNSNYPEAHARYGMLLMFSGRFDEAYTQLKTAERLDPTSLNIGTYLGLNFYFSRRYEQALEQFKKVSELAPNYGGIYYFQTLIYERKEMYEKAVEAELKWRELSKPQTVEPLRTAYKAGGVRAFWRKQIEFLEKEAADIPGVERDIASRYLLLGDKDKFYSYLEEAAQKRQTQRGNTWEALKVNPAYDSLRSDPKFQELLKRLNVPG